MERRLVLRAGVAFFTLTLFLKKAAQHPRRFLVHFQIVETLVALGRARRVEGGVIGVN